ncbi:MAG TPA: aldo/keto reductase [Candidatus Dormibacteraeota bacterium]|jgi:aryl-alcohol dehydrogenase-like predicted oxidoreductase/predicted kinase|nr:aldo/keto reductase [Candidatus Dormibacteraeota bacterium]
MSGPAWLDATEIRIGLGCMRLSTDPDRDEEVALATIAAAAAAGVTVFDTARAYGHSTAELGHNERLLARALRRCGAERSARIVSKGGMAREGGGWVADGRAGAILGDCEASLEDLDGLAIDLYLVHAPDPRTPWRTSVRALARLLDEGLVRHVGLGNVNRRQLDEARELVDVTAVQIALSLHDASAIRGGLVEHCAGNGIAVIAHSPLGGPRRAPGLMRHPVLTEVAEHSGATPAEVALAWLLDLSPAVVAIPGARRPETARSAARAASLTLDSGARDDLARSFGISRPARVDHLVRRDDADVVLVMGIPGAGKSRVADGYIARGHLRLNRDERGGSLRALAGDLEQALTSGVRKVVLDNTYLTRAARSHVIDVATRHHLPTRCIWIDTPLAQAQVNIVERLLQRCGGKLPSPDELRELARREAGMLAPASQMRALRELEPPSTDEGLVDVEQVTFERIPPSVPGRAGVFVAAAALRHPGWKELVLRGDQSAPHLVFDWQPDGTADALAACAADLSAVVPGPVQTALCPHAAGPPTCWCRPPLPGLALAFARAHSVDPARSVLIGTGATHRTLARALGAAYISA